MTDVFDQAFAVTTASVFEAVDELAQESAMSLRQDLAIQYPPASSPGEPPHRRTGGLQASVQAVTTADGGKVEANISVGHEGATGGGEGEVPIYLEFGTPRMAPRPHVRPEKDRIASIGLRAIAGKLSKGI